jgi:hypothetical protein
MEVQGIYSSLVRHLLLLLYSMGDPTNNYTTARITVEVLSAPKPSNHDKMGGKTNFPLSLFGKKKVELSL